MKYYLGFYQGDAPKEVAVLTLTSTKEEPKRIGKVVLTACEVNNGQIISIKLEREFVVENYRTKGIATAIEHVIELGIDLAVGQELTLITKNITSGQASSIQGYIEYEITR